MTIAYKSMPANLRTPGFYVEIDPTGAAQSFGGQPYKVLVIGQKLSSGSAAVNTPMRLTTAEQASLFFGKGSMLHAMALALFQNSQTVDATFMAMLDPAAGVAAVGSIKVASSPEVAGTIYLYVAGKRVQVGVTAAQAPAAIASAIITAVNAQVGGQMSAVIDGTDATKVNLTSMHKGTIGNSLFLGHSHLDGEFLPKGMALTIVQPTGGSGTPDLAAALANTGGDHFNLMVAPYTDAALLADLETDLAERAGPTLMVGSIAFTATAEAHGAALAFGDSRNTQYVSCMATYGSPTPTWEWAAAVAAQVSESASNDPARPFQTLPLLGVMAPSAGARFTLAEQNALLYDGIATHSVTSGGQVQIQRLITMYQEDATGSPDIALLDVNSPLCVERIRYDLRTTIARKYPRAKLGDDGAPAAGQILVTPKVIRAEILALFEVWRRAGLVEAPEQFERDLIVERNESDPNRIDIRLRPNLVNQLRVFGAQLAFTL
ncbi:MAG: phage tail sheath subtilisin-like domain-containing protein [Planctomycetota bacterium]